MDDDTDTHTDTDTDTDDYYYDDYDYSDYLYLKSLIRDYEVVAHSAQTVDSTSIAVTVGHIHVRTSDINSGSPIWDEVLMYGSSANIASTWRIDVGGTECLMDVSREMVEQWGGFSLDSCGDATDIAFYFVPIN